MQWTRRDCSAICLESMRSYWELTSSALSVQTHAYVWKKVNICISEGLVTIRPEDKARVNKMAELGTHLVKSISKSDIGEQIKEDEIAGTSDA